METLKDLIMIPFAEYSQRVEQEIENRYGIRVITRDVPDPLLGDLDGAEIQVDYAVTDEQRLFLLAHLFGHTVQWNVNPLALEIGRPRRPPVPEAQLPALMDYERQAASYALHLLHGLGIRDLDQWLADYTACDMAYLRNYYETGEKRRFQEFWHDGTPGIAPSPIPPFTPTKFMSRTEGIVI